MSHQNGGMWGEIEGPLPDLSYMWSAGLTDIMTNARKKDCLAMYAVPSYIIDKREIKLPGMDSRMLHTAQLHINKMEDTIKEAELAVKYKIALPTEMSPVLIPEPPIIYTSLNVRKPLQFIDKEYSDFSMGFGPKHPKLSETTRRKIEAKCVATMLTHIGFEKTNSSVLEVLIDVFEGFLNNICKELRKATDSEGFGEHTGFCDVLEKVLTQSGVGGVQGVCQYYEKRVKKYENVMKNRFNKVLEQYESLMGPVNSLKENCAEPSEESETHDVPEVHLTAKDGEEEYLQSLLESGYQMLNTLEGEQYG